MSLDNAFRELRKLGYWAERNYWCCNTCAWADIPEERADKVAFIHEQGESMLEDLGCAYIGWSGDGDEICEVLEANGVHTEWDGSEDSTIKVTV